MMIKKEIARALMDQQKFLFKYSLYFVEVLEQTILKKNSLSIEHFSGQVSAIMFTQNYYFVMYRIVRASHLLQQAKWFAEQ